MRLFIELAYNGAPYCGWQRQPDQPSVQQTLEESLSTLLRITTPVVGAGRTDTGVHASQIFAHCDVTLEALLQLESRQTKEQETTRLLKRLTQKLNSLLPKSIAVTQIFEVNDDAHARFDATSRSYRYRITTTKNPFTEDSVHYLRQSLDITAMQEACSYLLGKQDFQCFSKVKTDVNTYFCDITDAYWEVVDGEYHFRITANRFLRNMVRAIVGTLLYIGQGHAAPSHIEDVIASKDRGKAGTSVPAHGLYLTEVIYPDKIKG